MESCNKQAIQIGSGFDMNPSPGYIKNGLFSDVHIIDKGGNPLTDMANTPPELGVGQYNVY